MNKQADVRPQSGRGWRAGVTLVAGLLAGFSAFGQARYSYSSSGVEVTDSRTGLVWQRCSAGQSWSGGTCSGSATNYTHEGALAYAQSQSGWRLPNVKELASLVDRSRIDPAIDTAAFPETPSYYFWSSSPYAGRSGIAWSVYFDGGDVNGGGRYFNFHVRLVR